ncbi:mechanosensitive ion channel [Rubripirellula amarantea]|nr:mechanosensitive ion channel [Rubripirellula amarantea]
MSPLIIPNHRRHVQVRIQLAQLALVMAVVSVGFCRPALAQNIVYPSSYPQSYPVSNSYPSSYPIGSSQVISSSQSLPQGSSQGLPPGARIISSRVIEPTTVMHEPTVTRREPAVASRESYRDDSSDREIKREPPLQLAATRTYNSRPRFPINETTEQNRLGDNRFDELPVSPYRVATIHSARQTAEQFRRIAATSAPIAQTLATENANFADQWADLAQTNMSVSQRVFDANEKLESTRNDFETVNAKLTHYGLTPTIGTLLRHKREQLDQWQVDDSQTLFASDELKRSRQRQLELEMVDYDGSDPAAQTATLMTDAGYNSATIERSSLAAQIEGLLMQRSQWLHALQQGYEDYQAKIGELDSISTASVELTSDYRTLIDQHVIWIRSGDPVSVSDFKNLGGGISALFDSRRSADFGPTLDQKFRTDSVGAIGLLATIVFLLIVRWFAKSWLIGIGNRKRMKDSKPAVRKVASSVLTIVTASAIPGVLWAVARWLGNGIVSESTLYASGGFYAGSLVALAFELPRQLLRNFGYVDKHVEIDLPRRQTMMRYLTLVGICLVIGSYTITVMGSVDHGMWRGNVSRFGFMTAMLVIAWTSHRLFKPNGGSLEPFIAKFGGKVIHRVRYVIYVAAIAFPIALFALSALGYGFTANELTKRALFTLIAVFIGITLWASVKIVSAHGWQMLTGVTPPPRKFDEYGEIEVQAEVGVLGEHFLELKHHLAFLCQCALVLVAIVCFGWLWIDVFPNIRMGNPVVWNIKDTVTQTTVDAIGQTMTSEVTETTPVTALHLVMAAATLFVAFQLAKLLPALFDALVLQRVSFDEGMEHFSLVLGRCLLFGIGCFIACKWIGIRWQAIQWLAVGLTIGLGFGLQDMVRNLFGGLIVLFEKPARLGDLVSVGNVTGRVSFQKLRTTVLTDDDGREVIVPNKNFVSEDVVHWLGAGRLKVIPIEVAVTRDERPADVCRTLTELVLEQRDILLSPAPQATLVCVGKRSQRIEVRAWIEEGSDEYRFRDALLSTVTKFLKEKNWLAANQPSQPLMSDPLDSTSDDDFGMSRKRSRKRPA